MDAQRLLHGVCWAAGGAKKGIGSVLVKVNPNVWQELIYVSLMSYSLFLPRREQVTARPADGFPPLVMVHGLGANRGTMTALRAFLRLQGHRRMYSFGYEDGTIEGHGKRLSKYVKEVLDVTGTDQVDMVAHSLGGVISRYAIQRGGLEKKVRTLVTMATPHQGTYSAQYANTTLTIALRPDGQLIRDLNADDLTALATQFVFIYSDRDMYIIPKENMTHPDATNVFIPGVSHTQHLLAPKVFRVVGAFLPPEPGLESLTAEPDGGMA